MIIIEFLLEKAILIATTAHSGQLDKAGEPYILHPLRVMLSLNTYNEKIVGVLHDVIEDTDITIEYLKTNGFKDQLEILAALESLSRKGKESYEDFILRIKLNPLGTTVKLADLKDNMNLSRIKEPTEKDFLRTKKYKHALKILLSGK